MVSPGAASAAGTGSAARVVTELPHSSSTVAAVRKGGMAKLRTRHCERSEAIHSFFRQMDCFASLAMTLMDLRWLRGGLCRHRLGEVFRHLVEEARGGEPALVGAD